MNVLPLAAAAVLGALHFFAGRLRFLDGIPRSRWLSGAGGISVAYVIVHLLPEISEYQEAISAAAPAFLEPLERHAYLFALLGVAVFYGVELRARAAHRAADGGRAATVFSFASYAVYNAVIGYLLARRQEGLVLFAVAMGLHFVVNDRALREHHEQAYHQWGRWIVSATVVAGALLGVAVEVPEATLGSLVAFIGGGVLLNVLKEELPEERDSRFGAFVAGAAVYAAVLLAGVR